MVRAALFDPELRPSGCQGSLSCSLRCALPVVGALAEIPLHSARHSPPHSSTLHGTEYVSFLPLSREGSPRSPHTALTGPICDPSSEFFTLEPINCRLWRHYFLDILGAQKSLQFRRRPALRCESAGLLGATLSKLAALQFTIRILILFWAALSESPRRSE